MKLNSAIQEALIALLCYDDQPGGGSFVAAIVPPATFDAFYKEVAREAVAYREKYKEAPGEHTLDLINTIKARDEASEKIYDRIFESLVDIKDGINREYVVGEALAFAKHQRIKRGIGNALDSLETGTAAGVLEAEGALAEAIKSPDTDLSDAGTRLDDPEQALRFFDSREEVLPTGIDQLDALNVGPSRKGLHLFIALPSKGKSWWLVQLGKAAMLARLNVVHVTLEMSEEQTCQRYYQSIFSVSQRKASTEYYRFDRDDNGHFIDFDIEDAGKRPALDDPSTRSKLSRLASKRLKRKGKIVVKEFPAGELTLKQLDAYLDSLEASTSIVPDLLLVDYLDEMAIASDNYRIDLGVLVRGLRGLAQRRNIAVATASQANRKAESARWVTREHIAEDFSKIARTDTIVTYSQSPGEESIGMARLFLDKTRLQFVPCRRFLISQAYGIGQFCMDSARHVDNAYWPKLKEETNEGPDE